MELFTLVISKGNYLEFLDCNLSHYIMRGKRIDSYFLQQLRKLCRIIPEFTYQPILCRYDKMWCYDSECYWESNYGRCSLQFQNSYFGFNDKVNKFEFIRVDCKSFGIKQVSSGKIKKIAGVTFDYVSPVQQKLIEVQNQKFRVDSLKRQRAQLIAELESLKEDDM